MHNHRDATREVRNHFVRIIWFNFFHFPFFYLAIVWFHNLGPTGVIARAVSLFDLLATTTAHLCMAMPQLQAREVRRKTSEKKKISNVVAHMVWWIVGPAGLRGCNICTHI